MPTLPFHWYVSNILEFLSKTYIVFVNEFKKVTYKNLSNYFTLIVSACLCGAYSHNFCRHRLPCFFFLEVIDIVNSQNTKHLHNTPNLTRYLIENNR